MSQYMNYDHYFQSQTDFLSSLRKSGNALIQSAKPHVELMKDNLIKFIQRSYNWCRQAVNPYIQNYSSYYQGLPEEKRQVVVAVIGGCIGGIVVIRILLYWGRSNKSKNGSSDPVMRAVVATSYSGLKGLRILNDYPVHKSLAPDEILIRVRAASVDPMDIRILSGYGRVLRRRFLQYNQHPKSEFPLILGRECSGIVEDTGDAVLNFYAGDEVWMCVPYWQPGVMSEYAVIKEPQVALKPKTITFAEAAGVPYAAMITWEALVERGGLGPCSTSGKRVLIHAGSTPYGTLAIQLVKAWGGHVTTTVPTIGLPIARILGADDVVVYTVTDFQEELRQRPKFDVVLNTIGSVLHSACLEVCAPGGKVVSMVASPVLTDQYGFFTGIMVALYLHIRSWLWKLRKGNFLSSTWETFEFNREILDHIAHMIDVGQIRPVVEEVFPLEEARLAFHRVAEGQAVGRIVVAMPQLVNKN